MMPIQRWHWGKVAILWAWGCVSVAPLLYRFFSTPVGESPLVSLGALVVPLVVLLLLTTLTWRWLGGKEGLPPG
jgi:hypothetical protein